MSFNELKLEGDLWNARKVIVFLLEYCEQYYQYTRSGHCLYFVAFPVFLVIKTLIYFKEINKVIKNLLSLNYQYYLTTKYIPLTGWVRGPYCKLQTEFFPLRFMAQARSAWAINRRGKKRESVAYSTDREDEVSKNKIFIISLLCVWRIRERFLFMRNDFKFMKQVEGKPSQFEIDFKSLARFSTQVKVKESFKLLLAT